MAVDTQDMQCNYPGPAHLLTAQTATYWQVPGIGDICNECHDEWCKKSTSKPFDATIHGAPFETPDEMFLIICANGHVCNLPDFAGSSWEDEPPPPYYNRGQAESIRDRLDPPPLPGGTYQVARCGPHTIERYEREPDPVPDTPLRHNDPRDMECSFCGKSAEDRTLISGPRVFICHECVALSGEILIHEGRAFPARCKRDACDNRARYSSGYCGIHDIVHNGGRGKLR